MFDPMDLHRGTKPRGALMDLIDFYGLRGDILTAFSELRSSHSDLFWRARRELGNFWVRAVKRHGGKAERSVDDSVESFS